MTDATGARRSARLVARAEAKVKAKADAQAAVQPLSTPRTPNKKKPTSKNKEPSRTPIKKAARPTRKPTVRERVSITIPTIKAEPAEPKRILRPPRPRVRTSIATLGLPKQNTPRLVKSPISSDPDGPSTYSLEESSDSDSSSDSLISNFSMEDSASSSSYDEYNEQVPLSHDQIEYHHSHNLQPRRGASHRPSLASYDSRLESGNLDYEADSFVVDDDQTLLMEDSDESDFDDRPSPPSALNLAINMNRYPLPTTYRRPDLNPIRTSSLFSTYSTYPTASSASPWRVPVSAASSRLFFSDPDGDGGADAKLPPWTDLGFQTGGEAREAPLIAEASADVVEEIMDAVTMFSRRVNRGRESVRLRLAAAVLEDEEIRGLLEDAVRVGLGRKVSLGDGSKRWSIGGRGRR